MPGRSDARPWRQRLELDQTQQAIAAATGYTTSLLRQPGKLTRTGDHSAVPTPASTTD